MSASAYRHLSTVEDYFEAELASDQKHEYYGGRIFAMPGASPDHVAIADNVLVDLTNQLEGRPCRVRSSDLRICVQSRELYTYADVSVVCGEPNYGGYKNLSLLNPAVIVEVLSPTTEAYDRGLKSEFYRSMVSLQEYVLIAQDRIRMECLHRDASGIWILSETSELDGQIHLRSIDCSLRARDVYRDVTIQTQDMARRSRTEST